MDYLRSKLDMSSVEHVAAEHWLNSILGCSLYL